MNSTAELGIQSFCFREFKDNADVARKVRELGLHKIELCAVHADFDDRISAREISRIYADAGVEIISIGVQTFLGAEVEERWFAWAEEAGARHLSAHFKVDTYPRAIARVREWSRQYGVQVGIHNHGGYMFGGQPDVLRTLLALGAPEIGLCLDTAWCLQIGPKFGQPLEWIKEFRENLTALHLKDFRFEADGQWHDTLVGAGNLNLPELLRALRDQHFSGLHILEYEADPSDPVPALKQCIARIDAVLKDL